jgi:hypothetical protein
MLAVFSMSPDILASAPAYANACEVYIGAGDVATREAADEKQAAGRASSLHRSGRMTRLREIDLAQHDIARR